MCLVGYRATFAAFKDRSASACNVIQLGYMFGGIVSPAVVAPFINLAFSGIHFTFDGHIDQTNANRANDTRVINSTLASGRYLDTIDVSIIVVGKVCFYPMQ